ncbi:MAG: hypothetical protein RMY34_30225 [Aulosira sp. DedQUE10]|nr:hypothetical protein [Aulosira sp. DedQUE10]
MESRKEKYFLQPKHKRNVEAAIPCKDAIHRISSASRKSIASDVSASQGMRSPLIKQILRTESECDRKNDRPL